MDQHKQLIRYPWDTKASRMDGIIQLVVQHMWNTEQRMYADFYETSMYLEEVDPLTLD